MSKDRGVQLKKEAEKLFSTKSALDSLNQEIALNFYPRRADFTGSIELGEEFATHIVDTYPMLVCRDLADSFSSMLRPADRPWFIPYVDGEDAEEDHEAQLFLRERAPRVITSLISDRSSGFARATSETDRDLAAFGQGIISHTYNANRSGLVFKCHHPRDVVWLDDEAGNVSCVYRKSKQTIYAIVRQFGDKNIPHEWKKKASSDPECKFTVYHAVKPLGDYAERKDEAFQEKFASVYFTDAGTILSESVEDINPYVIPRWVTMSGSQYAFSPATIIALPQARLIQRMMLTLIEAAEKRVDPPLIATAETIKSEVDLSSGAITWVDREYDEKLGAPLRPLDLGKDPSIGIDLITRQQELLSECFYLNKLQLPDRNYKTAYETARLVEEYVRSALPLFQPLEAEYNSAILEAIMSRAINAGAFGGPQDIPEVLQGREVRFRFSNPLRDQMEKQKVLHYQETTQLLAVAAQIDPADVSNVDTAKALRDAVEGTGAPRDWMVPEEEALAAKQQQAQAQAAQQQAMAMSQGAQDMKTVMEANNQAAQAESAGNG
jgi:hypothetical protein